MEVPGPRLGVLDLDVCFSICEDAGLEEVDTGSCMCSQLLAVEKSIVDIHLHHGVVLKLACIDTQ